MVPGSRMPPLPFFYDGIELWKGKINDKLKRSITVVKSAVNGGKRKKRVGKWRGTAFFWWMMSRGRLSIWKK